MKVEYDIKIRNLKPFSLSNNEIIYTSAVERKCSMAYFLQCIRSLEINLLDYEPMYMFAEARGAEGHYVSLLSPYTASDQVVGLIEGKVLFGKNESN